MVCGTSCARDGVYSDFPDSPLSALSPLFDVQNDEFQILCLFRGE